MEHSKMPGVGQVLRDLRARLDEKLPVLINMGSEASTWNERLRLYGKAEGVRLAISFVDEAIRTTHSDENVS